MHLNLSRTTGLLRLGLLVVVSAALQPHAHAQNAKTPYPEMAPLDQYLMERNAEIALARSAAPESVSRDAEVLVLGRRGYESAAKGKNGFVCIVERSWTAGIDDPNFWNPKLRGPICFNAPAARTYLPITIKKTELVLAGGSKAQMFEGLKIAFDKNELPPLEFGAMSYMLSKDSYLGDGNGHWRPHLMFFVPRTDSAAWGANLPSSPIFASEVVEDRLTIFMVPVAKWSDGTPDATDHH
jgi:hypothetical protein